MSWTAEAPVPAEPAAAQAAETMRSRPYVGLLVVAAVIGVIVSLAAWGYLESVFQIQRGLFARLPHALGYEAGPAVVVAPPVLGWRVVPRRAGDYPCCRETAGTCPPRVSARAVSRARLVCPACLLAGLPHGRPSGSCSVQEGPLLALGWVWRC